jgi:hypothetical protein
MQQFCTYGSVRGAPGDRRPYRDKKDFRSLLGRLAQPISTSAHIRDTTTKRVPALTSRSRDTAGPGVTLPGTLGLTRAAGVAASIIAATGLGAPTPSLSYL